MTYCRSHSAKNYLEKDLDDTPPPTSPPFPLTNGEGGREDGDRRKWCSFDGGGGGGGGGDTLGEIKGGWRKKKRFWRLAAGGLLLLLLLLHFSRRQSLINGRKKREAACPSHLTRRTHTTNTGFLRQKKATFSFRVMCKYSRKWGHTAATAATELGGNYFTVKSFSHVLPTFTRRFPCKAIEFPGFSPFLW